MTTEQEFWRSRAGSGNDKKETKRWRPLERPLSLHLVQLHP